MMKYNFLSLMLHRIEFVVYILLIQISAATTPLKRLLLNPAEHTKPMLAMTNDIISALNEELLVADEYYSRKQTASIRNPRITKIPRAFEISFLQQNFLKPPVDFGDLTRYVILRDSQTVCNGRDLIQVEKPSLTTFANAQATCDELPQCSYFVWKPKLQESRGVAWYCAGDGWMCSRYKKDWVVATKRNQFHLDGYDVQLNVAMMCARPQELQTIYGPLGMDKASQRCLELGCTYFTISYVGYLKEKGTVLPKGTGQKTQFCNGQPSRLSGTSPTKTLGWVSGVRLQKSTKKLRLSISDKNQGSVSRLEMPELELSKNLNGHSGPIIQHDYSWMGQKGDIISNPLVGWPSSKA